MRILHVTDLHYNKKWYAWLRNIAPYYDHVCISGDLIDLVRRTEPIPEQMDFVIKFLLEWDGPHLHICSGNHDRWFWGVHKCRKQLMYSPYTDENTLQIKLRTTQFHPNVHIHKDLVFENIRFLSVPWYGDDVYPPVEIEKHAATIILAHCPPNTNSTIYKTAAESNRLVYFLSGHYHTPYNNHSIYNNVNILNPGMEEDLDVPPHFIIEIKEKVNVTYIK